MPQRFEPVDRVLDELSELAARRLDLVDGRLRDGAELDRIENEAACLPGEVDERQPQAEVLEAQQREELLGHGLRGIACARDR